MTARTIQSFLLGTAIIVTEARAADWVAQYQSGEEKLGLGMIEEAWRDLQKALAAAESSNAERAGLRAILDALGRTQFLAGGYRNSVHYFERVLRLCDLPVDRVIPLCNAGQAYGELGEYDRAERYVREAVEIAPTEPRAWQLLGSVLIKRRRYREAEAAEQKALSLGDSGMAASVWCDLAALHEAQGGYEQSVEALQRAIAVTKAGRQRARMLANLGAVERRLRRADDAVVHLSQAVQEMEAAAGPRHPDVAAILDYYSVALRHAGRRSEGKQAAQRAKEIRSLLPNTVDWRDLK